MNGHGPGACVACWHISAQAALDIFHGPRLDIVERNGKRVAILDVRGTEFDPPSPSPAQLARELAESFLLAPKRVMADGPSGFDQAIPMPYAGKL